MTGTVLDAGNTVMTKIGPCLQEEKKTNNLEQPGQSCDSHRLRAPEQRGTSPSLVGLKNGGNVVLGRRRA